MRGNIEVCFEHRHTPVTDSESLAELDRTEPGAVPYGYAARQRARARASALAEITEGYATRTVASPDGKGLIVIAVEMPEAERRERAALYAEARADCDAIVEEGRRRSAESQRKMRARRERREREARRRGSHTEAQWAAMIVACHNACARCHAPFSHTPPIRDHVIPIARPECTDAIENIQPLCAHCNSIKRDDDTDYRPVSWRDSFAAWGVPT